jgi:hypothetical protein
MRKILRLLPGVLLTLAGTAALLVLFAIVFAGHLIVFPVERIQRGAMILVGWILSAPPPR